MEDLVFLRIMDHSTKEYDKEDYEKVVSEGIYADAMTMLTDVASGLKSSFSRLGNFMISTPSTNLELGS